MANQKFLVDLDLNKNQLLNAVAQNLAVAPENAKAGQFYFDTAEGTLKWYTGSEWSSGKVYTFEGGLTETDGVVTLDEATAEALGGVKLLATGTLAEADTTAAISAGFLLNNVDSAITAESGNLATSGAVFTAIANALVGGVKFQGDFDASAGSYDAIATAKKGDEYAISAAGVVDGIDYNVGDLLLVVNDNPTSSSDVVKIDNTEATDIVRLTAEQTLTNKTISATDNTITGLAKANFAEGVVVTDLVDATDDEIPTAKAVAQAIEAGGAAAASKQIITNSELTPAGGVCTWTAENPTTDAFPVCSLYETATGTIVIAEITSSANSITVKINSETVIAAGTYSLAVMGIMG